MRFIRILSFLLLLSCLLSSCHATQPTTDDSTSTPQTNESTTEAITTEPIETVWLDALPDVDYFALSEEELWALVPENEELIQQIVDIYRYVAEHEQDALAQHWAQASPSPEGCPGRAQVLSLAEIDLLIPYLLKVAKDGIAHYYALTNATEAFDPAERNHAMTIARWTRYIALDLFCEEATSHWNTIRTEILESDRTAAEKDLLLADAKLRVFLTAYREGNAGVDHPLDALTGADHLVFSAEELVALIPSDTAIEEALVPLSESLIAHYEQNGLFHLSAPPDEVPYQADALAIDPNIIPHLLAYGHRSEVLSADMKANEDAYVAQGYTPGAWQKELHRARVLRDLACALMGVTLSERTDFLNDLTDKGIDVLITEDGAVATNHSVRILRLYCYTLKTGS